MVRIHSPRPILSIIYRRWAQKQPTHLPTHIALLGESKVRILRSWQRTLPRLSVPANRFRPAYGPSWPPSRFRCQRSRAPRAANGCAGGVGEKDRTPRRQSMGRFLPSLDDRREQSTRAHQEGKDARTGFDAKGGAPGEVAGGLGLARKGLETPLNLETAVVRRIRGQISAVGVSCR